MPNYNPLNTPNDDDFKECSVCFERKSKHLFAKNCTRCRSCLQHSNTSLKRRAKNAEDSAAYYGKLGTTDEL